MALKRKTKTRGMANTIMVTTITKMMMFTMGWLYSAEWRNGGPAERNGGTHGIFFLPVSGLCRITKLRMIIVHFLVTKGTKKVSQRRDHTKWFTSGRYVSPLPFLCLSDCAETSQAHFPKLRERKTEKDAHGKCLSYLKNMIYDMLSFLLQGNLSQCLL